MLSVIYLAVVVIISLCILSPKFRQIVAKLILGTLAVAILIYGACALQNAARAEELPEGFYLKAIFVDDIEKVEDEEDLLIHADDLDHIWDYWEDPEEDFEDEINWDMELLAMRFIRENQLEAIIDMDCCIKRGRIAILTMWECDPENPWDEEVVDIYYSGFVTW